MKTKDVTDSPTQVSGCRCHSACHESEAWCVLRQGSVRSLQVYVDPCRRLLFRLQ